MTLAERRRALMGKKTGGGLPSEYQQVDYIVSGNSSNRILTDFHFQRYDTVNFRFSVANTEGTTKNLFRTNASAENSCMCAAYSSSLYQNWFSSGGTNKIGPSNTLVRNKVFDVTYANGTASFTDGINTYSSSYPAYGGVPSKPLTLIGHTDGTQGLLGRMYEFTVHRNGECVFDAVPCYRKSDNVVGVYERISKTFLTNSGTGTLTWGNDI